ncbi:uncharacterized protein THITE_2056637 [Thermothielavioides terrestris NRRL 8126]|uniref:tyrosinase n=1 Tax=Thermothielavioides terrestris (strain ATCC 38088 / NRRL 8126) TaxID=578455 RepID=G2RCR3_THETT|nr:uncharacterized protein THITE_2056637 [Thermothielavioides terrestris NRRL 8126]AEO70659.1 hypothetical protein THITE_2056637 [Thermothielavioides terrestris NRRL 8126]
MSGNIAITGIPTTPGSDGSVPLRRELRDLQKNHPDEFNLFILGLKSLEGKDEKGLTSYYQIAGIHGMPYKPWNGVGSDTDWQSDGGFGGYCTHSSILFLTWHRPYLALYEKSLYDAVQDVAKQFPQGALRDKYVQAAKTFRAPYFDWASQPPRGSSAFPSVLTTANIQVVDVDGKAKSVTNPLYRFSFHPMNPSPEDFSRQWSRYPTTVRYPNRVTGQSQDSRIAPILANELASLRNNVSLLLLSYTNYDAFSFNAWDPNTNSGEFGSLEDVHNEIHDRTGGGGHMSALEVSAFDPFFWLHHVNVDRLWAIWQDLNPDSFMSPRPAPYSTFSVTGGDIQSEDTPLEPFWDKSGTKFWTSAQIKDTTTFGYAYPETQKWRFPDQQSYQTSIRQAVTALYGTNVFTNFVANNLAKRKDEHAPTVFTTLASAPPSHPPLSSSSAKQEAEEGPIPASLRHLAPNNAYTEWVVNVRAEKHGLGASFRVLVFLGAFDEADPSGWDTEFNCVGRVSVLGRDGQTTQCARCRSDAAGGLMVSGTVPLTSALLQDIAVEGQLASLRPEDVVPHLRRQLAWRVTLFDGEERNVEQVPGLKVSVASTEVTIGEDGLPNYSGEYRVWPEVTDGKPAGLSEGEHV